MTQAGLELQSLECWNYRRVVLSSWLPLDWNHQEKVRIIGGSEVKTCFEITNFNLFTSNINFLLGRLICDFIPNLEAEKFYLIDLI